MIESLFLFGQHLSDSTIPAYVQDGPVLIKAKKFAHIAICKLLYDTGAIRQPISLFLNSEKLKSAFRADDSKR